LGARRLVPTLSAARWQPHWRQPGHPFRSCSSLPITLSLASAMLLLAFAMRLAMVPRHCILATRRPRLGWADTDSIDPWITLQEPKFTFLSLKQPGPGGGGPRHCDSDMNSDSNCSIVNGQPQVNGRPRGQVAFSAHNENLQLHPYDLIAKTNDYYSLLHMLHHIGWFVRWFRAGWRALLFFGL
jgi:hypothetical protein